MKAPPLQPVSETFDPAQFQAPAEHVFACELVITEAMVSPLVDHVANTEYVRWLDRAAELHADAVSYTRQRMLNDAVMWFVVRHEIDYLAEVRLGDRLVIATWVRSVEKTKSWRDFVILRPTDGMQVCRASTLYVLVDLQTRRPARVPLEMVDAFWPVRLPSAPSACR